MVLNGFRIPALSTRRTETEIELRNGQTFAIAGLLNNQMQSTMQKIPGIGDIPILGYLFRSKVAKKEQTELVVMITPEILPNDSPGVTDRLPRTPDTFMPPVSEKQLKQPLPPAFTPARSQANVTTHRRSDHAGPLRLRAGRSTRASARRWPRRKQIEAQQRAAAEQRGRAEQQRAQAGAERPRSRPSPASSCRGAEAHRRDDAREDQAQAEGREALKERRAGRGREAGEGTGQARRPGGQGESQGRQGGGGRGQEAGSRREEAGWGGQASGCATAGAAAGDRRGVRSAAGFGSGISG